MVAVWWAPPHLAMVTMINILLVHKLTYFQTLWSRVTLSWSVFWEDGRQDDLVQHKCLPVSPACWKEYSNRVYVTAYWNIYRCIYYPEYLNLNLIFIHFFFISPSANSRKCSLCIVLMEILRLFISYFWNCQQPYESIFIIHISCDW